MRVSLVALALIAGAPLAAQPAGQSDEVTCVKAGGDAEWRITACTNRLKLKSLTPFQRAQALFFRADSLSRSGDHRAALADIDAALRLKLEPHVREAVLITKAQILLRSKQMVRALAVADQAVALRSGTNAYYFRGQLKSERGDYRGALTDYDRSNAAGSKDYLSWNSACWTRAADLNIELDKARTECARALELAPANSSVLDSAGMVELRQGRYSAAWRFYDRAVRADSRESSALFGRGLAALKLGRTSEGNADIAAALRVKPEVASDYAKRGLKP